MRLFAAILAFFFAAWPPSARAADQVTIAYIGGTADVGFYIADAKGYLRDEGIEAKFVVFDSSARMVAPLATGEVDVGSGAVGAGTYNAFERGITLRAVADKARNKGVFSYQGLMVRKDLWDSGAVRTLKDLKGHKFAMTAPGSNEWVVLSEAARPIEKITARHHKLAQDMIETMYEAEGIGLAASGHPTLLAQLEGDIGGVRLVPAVEGDVVGDQELPGAGDQGAGPGMLAGRPTRDP